MLRIAVALSLAVLVLIASPSVEAITKKVILQLKYSAAQKYNPDMTAYTVLVIKGKAFATTRGTVNGEAWVALWEYNGGRWQFVYEHPARPADPAEVARWYSSYGFKTWQRQKLQKGYKPFPKG